MSTEGPRLVPAVAREMLRRRDDFIVELMEATRSEIGVLHHDDRMRDLLEASITENIVAAVHYLEYDTPADAVEAPTAAIVYARSLAQRDVPLSALIRAYRIGHARFLDGAMRYAATFDPDRSSSTIIDLVARSAAWIDRICEQVSVAYEQERERWVGSRSGLRQQWVNHLLSGTGGDIRRAEEALQYRLGGVHLSVAMWPDTAVPARSTVSLFDEARAWLGNELAATGHPLMVPTDEREVRVWFPVRSTEPIDFARLRDALRSSGLQVRIAFGNPAEGLDGFRRSHAQASRVRRIAVAAGQHSPRVIGYAQLAPIALMSEDLDGLRGFVDTMLGDLAVDDERNEWLRDTLRVFLTHNRSYAATADQMILHRNTIRYRVDQATERSGHSFDDPETLLKLHIALEACRWLGPAVLHAPVSR